jgi:hypothetical protein
MSTDVLPGLGAIVLDLRGDTVISGIVGMHNHLFYMGRPNVDPGHVPSWEKQKLLPEMPFSSVRLYLAAEVTTSARKLDLFGVHRSTQNTAMRGKNGP